MMTLFEKYYSKYMGTAKGFSDFHNEVINMPRDQFSDTGLNKVRLLSGYLLLTENKLDSEGANYKETMQCISEQLKKGIYPKYRDTNLENRYFNYTDLDKHYDTEGRMFRHLMFLCSFFGFVNSISKNKKVFNYDKCREYYLSDDNILMPVARNNMMMLNIRDNDFFQSLKGIIVDDTTDYRPTYAILRYIKEIGRGATRFELSVLLGRVDDYKQENDILDRAINIGRILPKTERQQIPYFFSNMNWKNSQKEHFVYSRSQEPYFKFNSYLLFLENFELIKYEEINDVYFLTDYAKELLSSDISYLVADLEKLLNIIDDYSVDNRELNDLILHQRNLDLLRYAKEDDQFIIKMNKRSLNNPIIGRDGKRKRNKLIAELAKIQADYKCQYEQREIFIMPNGKPYCEAHHIIEFSTENGPDITNNLVVLGPEAHMIIHHARKEDIDDIFMKLRINNAITMDSFKEMITIYQCLSVEQIEALSNKKIITHIEKKELLQLKEQYM